MAELDVAKRRKAFRDNTSWIVVIPHGRLSHGSGNVDKRLGGDSISPRQSHVQPSLAPTKNVNMKTKIRVNKLKRKASRLSLVAKMNVMSDNEVAAALRTASDGFLASQAWKDLRVLAIKRYGLSCLCCGRDNSRRFPINIDHIKPRKFFPELALDIENLQPLCGPCNKRKGNQTIDYR
jgi:5-methylcytosine-specific restriction endonuclease McrA